MTDIPTDGYIVSDSTGVRATGATPREAWDNFMAQEKQLGRIVYDERYGKPFEDCWGITTERKLREEFTIARRTVTGT